MWLNSGLSAKPIVQINDWISYSRASDLTVLILMQSSHASLDKVTTFHYSFIFKVIFIISGLKKHPYKITCTKIFQPLPRKLSLNHLFIFISIIVIKENHISKIYLQQHLSNPIPAAYQLVLQ